MIRKAFCIERAIFSYPVSTSYGKEYVVIKSSVQLSFALCFCQESVLTWITDKSSSVATFPRSNYSSSFLSTDGSDIRPFLYPGTGLRANSASERISDLTIDMHDGGMHECKFDKGTYLTYFFLGYKGRSHRGCLG